MTSHTIYTVVMTNKFGKSVVGRALSENGARAAASFYWTHSFGDKRPRTIEVTAEDKDAGGLVHTELNGEPVVMCLDCLGPEREIIDIADTGDCVECGEWI